MGNREGGIMTAPPIREIAGRFGLRLVGRSWRGTCPRCAYPDGAVLRPGCEGSQPTIWCAACGENFLADDTLRPLPSSKHPPDQQALTAKVKRTWDGAGPCAGTPAERYLGQRGLPHLIASPALRFREDCSHPEQRGRFLALVASVVDFAGRLIAVHRTYITRDGRKADVNPVRASLGSIRGGAVRLADPEDGKRLVIGEGIESSTSCGLLTDQPAWAAIAAGNLGWRLVLPTDIKMILVAADRDRPGVHAAEAAAERWRAEERDVLIASPDKLGVDFNDLLLAQRGQQ